jgi:hypothetical protein
MLGRFGVGRLLSFRIRLLLSVASVRYVRTSIPSHRIGFEFSRLALFACLSELRRIIARCIRVAIRETCALV